jgi:hypothetical protein
MLAAAATSAVGLWIVRGSSVLALAAVLAVSVVVAVVAASIATRLAR